jgi:hypothetical protein
MEHHWNAFKIKKPKTLQLSLLYMMIKDWQLIFGMINQEEAIDGRFIFNQTFWSKTTTIHPVYSYLSIR